MENNADTACAEDVSEVTLRDQQNSATAEALIINKYTVKSIALNPECCHHPCFSSSPDGTRLQWK